MDIIKRLLVGLDFTPMDDSEIAYAAFLAGQSSVESVSFIYVIRKEDLPKALADNFAGNKEQVKETLRNELERKVQPYFKDLPQVTVQIRVEAGAEVKEILKVADDEGIDLLLVGRKLQLKGSGNLPNKLLRECKRSVLFVPENTKPELQHITVSIDFSEYSMMALDRILHSAITRPEIKIQCLYVYEVPPGYITLGESYEAFDLKMQQNAKDKFEKVLHTFPELRGRAGIQLVKQEQDDNVGELIALEAKRMQTHLLVVGAAGKSAAARFFLGSTTEKILYHDMDVPLLVFKRENEDIGFVDALLREE